MGSQKTDHISQEARELISCVTAILDDKKIKYEFAAVDLSHAESIWYQVTIKTRPESGLLKLVLLMGRDNITLFCNDYQIFIYLTEQPLDLTTWLEHLPQIISAIFRPEIRIRGRFSLLQGGKVAAIWLELPNGGKWMGNKKACKGSGKEYVFKDAFQREP